MGFSSPCPASETPSASAPPHLRDTCDGSPSAEWGEGEEEEGRRGEEWKRERGGGGEGNKRKENQSRSSVLTCFSWQ